VSGGLERKPGGSNLVQRATADAADLAPGKRTLTGQLGPGVPGAAPEHTATAHQVAERDHLNAVITVVARGLDGAVLARWRARGHWVGPLPARYHGTHTPLAWTWSDPAARETRLHTLSDGTGGEPIERWATQHGAATVDVIATALDAAPDDEAAEAHSDPAAVPGRESAAERPAGPDPLAGSDPDQEQLIAEFERQLAIDLDLAVGDDARGGHGAPGGDPHGRTGPDTAIGGAGPGGSKARAGGDHEGSETRGAVEGSRLGSALGVKGGSEGGRYGGEGKPGDNGVRGAGAIAGGVIAIPVALKGIVEILLLADAGDVTGAGGELFARLGKRVAGMSAAALRELVAQEARAACRSAVEAAVAKLARSPKWLALSAEEQLRAMRIAFNEQTRRFFRGFGKAAKDGERAATKSLRGTTGAREIAAQESLDAARVGAEAAKVEPVAGRLPRNHEYAGKEFSRELLPPKYREKGLRFKNTGYPDFEPYAMTLPNGKKTVRIELTGSREVDRMAANRAAGFQRPPEGYAWHHLEDEGTMMLVPLDLHRAVAHTGGAAKYVDRTGVMAYE
jgi:A nuclease of the HNH/ENDO VII superfamily with conserved WHH